MAKKKEIELEEVQETEIISEENNAQDNSNIPQNDLEIAEAVEDANKTIDSPDTETGFTSVVEEPASDNSVKPESDEVAQTETETEKKPKKKRKTKEVNAQADSVKDSFAKLLDAVKPKKQTTAKLKQSVVAIDAVRQVETDADKTQKDLLDLIESMKTGKILSGTIQGVEKAAEHSSSSLAVIYHGEFKVVIPAPEAVNPPDDFRDMEPEDVYNYLLNKRLGAEVDYVVTGIDIESGMAIASRLDAMKMKRKQYYFTADRDGNNILHAGVCAEARVVSVIRAGIFADIFGEEVYIPLRELSYQRVMDASGYFQPGQRILVKLTRVEHIDKDNIKVTASVKQASENPYEKALKKYTVGNRYVGSVSVVDTNGVFVALDGGIDCLCSYPKRGRPPRGARVTVRILGINHETNRIWGAITHIAMPR